MLWLGLLSGDVQSAPDPTIGRRGVSGPETQQRLKCGLRGPPTIVPKHELIEVDLKLGLAHPVVGVPLRSVLFGSGVRVSRRRDGLRGRARWRVRADCGKGQRSEWCWEV